MENVLALVVATAVLVAIPGPNVALIVAQCLQRGLRYGLITVGATTLGVALQLLLVVAGLSAVLETAASTLSWIKWLGVVYLVWLGISTWRTRAQTPDSMRRPKIARTVSQGLLLAVVNPKTLLFNAAFLPQFVDSGAGQPVAELALLAAAYLAVILVGDVGWALGANGARRWFTRPGRWRNRLSGGFLVGAGVGLSLARHDG